MAETNLTCDVSHYQKNIHWSDVAAGPTKYVIVKCTQGMTIIDQAFADHVRGVKSVHLGLGLYHFGTFGPGRDQAKRFLDVGKPDARTQLMLDWEDDPRGPDQTLPQAEDFVQQIHEDTKNWPMFYMNYWWQYPMAERKSVILANCPLVIACLPLTVKVPKTWDHWTFHQYTNGSQGKSPHFTPGVGYCDRDIFNGTEAELDRFWNHSAQVQPIPENVPTVTVAPANHTIKQIQQRLLDKGYKLPKFGADGLWGDESSLALALFQGDAGLPKTGALSAGTAEKLFA